MRSHVDDTRVGRALFIDIRRLSIISWMDILSVWKSSRTKKEKNKKKKKERYGRVFDTHDESLSFESDRKRLRICGY